VKPPGIVQSAATTEQFIFAVVYLSFAVVLIISLVISFLKGKFIAPLLLLVLTGGFLVPVVAVRLAKPRSWWSRRYYDDTKLRRSYERYEFDPETAARNLRATTARRNRRRDERP
jgi:hypothetical protein